jgi:general secretion pathway protein A
MVEYIAHRLAIAGSRGGISFTPAALRRIYAYSRGYPRLINIICDRSLLAGYSERSRVITSRMVRKAILGIRGKQNEEGFRVVKSWMLVYPLVALLALAILAMLGYWLWRNSLMARNVSDSIQPVAIAAEQPRDAVSDIRASAAEPPRTETADPRETPVVRSADAPQPGPPAAKPVPGVQGPRQPHAGSPPPELQMADGPGKGAAANGALAEFSGRYLLQVHSLATRDQADAAITSLQKKGYPAFVRIEQNPQGRSWYVIYAGPYDSFAAARERAVALSQDATIHPIIRGY